MLYAKLEEEHGLARHALSIYNRATKAVEEKAHGPPIGHLGAGWWMGLGDESTKNLEGKQEKYGEKLWDVWQ